MFPGLVQRRPDDIVVLVGKGKVASAKLREPQAADDLFDRIRHGPVWAWHRHDLGRILAQPIRKPPQLRRIIPVHPVAEANRLLRLHGRHAQHALLAAQHKAIEPIGLDVLLGSKAELLFDLHLDPQALAIKAVLVAQLSALHGPKAAKEVLVGASPAMMHAHGIVGCDGPVDERPVRLALVELAQFIKGVRLLPKAEHLPLLRDKIHIGRNRVERSHALLLCWIRKQNSSHPLGTRAASSIPRYHPAWRMPTHPCPGRQRCHRDRRALLTGAKPGASTGPCPRCGGLSGASSGGIFGQPRHTRIPPSPGSLSAGAGLLVSVTADLTAIIPAP